MAPSLQPDVASLVTAHIRTYEQLDVLAWLARRKGHRETLSSIADALAGEPVAIAKILADLSAPGLVRVHRDSQGTSYEVADSYDDVMHRLVEAHDSNLTGLISLLNAQAFERIRATARRALLERAHGPGGENVDLLRRRSGDEEVERDGEATGSCESQSRERTMANRTRESR